MVWNASTQLFPAVTSAILVLLTPDVFFPSSLFQALAAAIFLGFFRTPHVINGFSVNDDNSGRDGVTSEGNLFARVHSVTLNAPRWWLLVTFPVNTVHGRDTKNHQQSD